MSKKTITEIILLWVAWAIIVLGFQTVAAMRVSPSRPDNSLFWTANETGSKSQEGKPYLLEPFLNKQVSWDAEYYLSIAVGSYGDLLMRRVPVPDGRLVSQNYAFFGFYPFVVRLVAIPLQVFDLSLIGTAALSGVIVSLLGTLVGIFALYELVKDELEGSGALRAVFYLLVFPTGFFLAQVYTEGLFIGLAFWALLFLQRRQWLWAGLLAVFTVWTRAVGVALIAAFAVDWVLSIKWKKTLKPQLTREKWLMLVPILLPLAAFLGWRFSVYGRNFFAVEAGFFSRGTLVIGRSIRGWKDALKVFGTQNGQGKVVYAMEIVTILLATASCFITLRKYPAISVFGLACIGIAVFSGVPQSMARYMLVVPSMYLVLARWGKNEVFDRAWTTASVLLMGLTAYLYTFDLWAG